MKYFNLNDIPSTCWSRVFTAQLSEYTLCAKSLQKLSQFLVYGTFGGLIYLPIKLKFSFICSIAFSECCAPANLCKIIKLELLWCWLLNDSVFFFRNFTKKLVQLMLRPKISGKGTTFGNRNPDKNFCRELSFSFKSSNV